MRVADIETEIEFEMCLAQEKHEALGTGERVGRIFEQHLDSALSRKEANFLKRAESRVDLALIVLFTRDADVLDQITERNRLGDFERTLNLVHHRKAFRFRCFGDIDHRMRTGAAPHVIVIHGCMHGMQLQFGIAKPMAEFADLRGVAIVQVLSRAKELDRGNTRLPDLLEPGGGEPMICEDVS